MLQLELAQKVLSGILRCIPTRRGPAAQSPAVFWEDSTCRRTWTPSLSEGSRGAFSEDHHGDDSPSPSDSGMENHSNAVSNGQNLGKRREMNPAESAQASRSCLPSSPRGERGAGRGVRTRTTGTRCAGGSPLRDVGRSSTRKTRSGPASSCVWPCVLPQLGHSSEFASQQPRRDRRPPPRCRREPQGVGGPRAPPGATPQ